MEVEVLYGLACVIAAVVDDTVALDTLGLCNLCSCLEYLCHERGVLLCNVICTCDMHLGDDEVVYRCDRSYVLE